jgi:hypothetical protein
MHIHRGRMTAEIEGDFVVFLIGMRVNRPWKIWKWLPMASAMPRMIAELSANPDSGFLGGAAWFGRTPLMVQYWRSVDHLLKYATDREAQHLPAWKAFNRAIGSNGDVGIFHETYPVAAGGYETIYVNMPPFGLGAAGRTVPIREKLNTALDRLKAGSGTPS